MEASTADSNDVLLANMTLYVAARKKSFVVDCPLYVALAN